MRVRIPSDVVFRDLAGETILLNLTTGTYFGLDAVATRVWRHVQDHGSTDTVIPAMLAEYDVDAARLGGDVDALIAQLLEKGLLVDAERVSSGS
ncbi:MAG TPA: PqqD family protein [Nitrospirales bacterium]|nr:PqqD family protein [Nitrospirales bacterium]